MYVNIQITNYINNNNNNSNNGNNNNNSNNGNSNIINFKAEISRVKGHIIQCIISSKSF